MEAELVLFQEPEIPIDLCDRERDGIKVILYWLRSLNVCSLYIEDVRISEAEQFVVPNAVAMEAFRHPFGYKAMNDHKKV